MGLVNKKIANGYIAEDVSLTFYCMNDMKIKTILNSKNLQ